MPANDDVRPEPPKVVLTIAGFDPSNGAGVTADLQVFAAHGLFGTAAITALTVQSTQGVAAVEPVSAKTLRATLDHLVADLPPAGIKIGMLGSVEIVECVASFLRSLSDISGFVRPIVVLDPVLRSSSGAKLLDDEAMEALRSELIPLVSWITPNTFELGHLAGNVAAEVRQNLMAFSERLPAVGIVATGGDEHGPPTEHVWFPGGRIEEFRGTRVNTTSTHGTGCAFSSALLSQLVLGNSAGIAVRLAKQYVEGGLRHAPGVGRGVGPMDLLWPRSSC